MWGCCTFFREWLEEFVEHWEAVVSDPEKCSLYLAHEHY